MQVRRHGRIYAAPPQVRMIPTTSQRSALLSKSRSEVERCYANDERCHAEGQLSITSGYDLLSAWKALEIWALTIGVVKCFNPGLVYKCLPRPIPRGNGPQWPARACDVWTSASFYDTEAMNRDKKINENFIGGAANETNAAFMLLRLV